MPSNSFGQIFRITTFGESHGVGVGVVIDGCPAGIALTEEEINRALERRRPGRGPYTSPRKEVDRAQILSGVFEARTTGAPVALWIASSDVDSRPYEALKDLYRPGHAQFAYLEKYGVFDYRGGGRASARETAARVAAGAVAEKLLAHFGIECVAYLAELGGIRAHCEAPTRRSVLDSPIFCPDADAALRMIEALERVQEMGDSLGGIVACMAKVPAGLGDPVYEKIEARLAYGMLSLPASKGFEIDAGFEAARMRGSEHNAPFTLDERGEVFTAASTLGGITTGAPLCFRVAFKPTASIKKGQETVTLEKERATFKLPEGGRHDPCVAIRAVPVVEAMTQLILADALLLHRCSCIDAHRLSPVPTN